MAKNEEIKPIIYQLLPRLYTNYTQVPVPHGTIEQNGCGKLRDINPTILKQLRQMGVTHVWYTGVIEHGHTSDYTQFGISKHNPYIIKGKAGSPYAITDYYDIDPDLAVDVPHRIEEFELLVERTHKAGMKVIIDFVPNHVSREYHSDKHPRGVTDLGVGDNKDMFFSPNNNFYYITRQQFAPIGVDLGHGEGAYVEFPARASGDDCFTAFPGKYNWYDTVKLNYGFDPGNHTRHFQPTPSTWHKMLDILKYWTKKGVDGFRCDMVHMVPVEFWNWVIPQVKKINPDAIFIAELYEVGIYRQFIQYGGFDYLYDKVNLYDTLRAIETANHSAANITSCWQTVDGISANMLNFLENHDEQRFASEQYAGNASYVVPSLVVSSMISTGPFMIYAGQELGEKANESEGYSGYDGRTTIFDYWSIPTLRRWLNKGKCDGPLTPVEQWLRDTYSRILNLCNTEKAISEGKFFDLMYVNYDNPRFNPHRQFAFLRAYNNEVLVIIVNFADEEASVEVNIPAHALDFLKIPAGYVKAKDLLSDVESVKTISSTTPFASHIPAHGAVIWKIDTKNIKPIPQIKKLVSNK